MKCVPEEQQVDAIRIWQSKSATLTEDAMESIARVESVKQSVVPGVEQREHRLSQSVRWNT